MTIVRSPRRVPTFQAERGANGKSGVKNVFTRVWGKAIEAVRAVGRRALVPAAETADTVVLGGWRREWVALLGVMRSRFRAWWHGESVTFTRLCATDEGETFTHGEVVVAHVVLVILLIVAGIGGGL